MRYLALALFAEGPTDQEFLPRILFRLVTEISAELSDQPVEVPELFIRPRSIRTRGGISRAERVLALFGEALDSVDLLFIHADADSDPVTAYETRVQPCCNLLHAVHRHCRFQCIGVIPVRETEAWAIADVNAVTRALGTTRRADELGLPDSPARAERVADPKAVLRAAQHIVLGRSRQGRLQAAPLHAVLGETVQLAILRQMEAFRQLEIRLRDALQALWHT
jgi:hypothetical protein